METYHRRRKSPGWSATKTRRATLHRCWNRGVCAGLDDVGQPSILLGDEREIAQLLLVPSVGQIFLDFLLRIAALQFNWLDHQQVGPFDSRLQLLVALVEFPPKVAANLFPDGLAHQGAGPCPPRVLEQQL